MNKYLIVIAGPTAVGKTSIAIQLAKHFHCSILSADSRQIYKEMSIGTAKPTKIELNTVKHHFINHISIQENYNAGTFESESIKLLDEIFQSQNVAILCGGTGLYIDAVLKGLDEFPKVDLNYKQYLEQEELVILQQMLKERDPLYYEQVDLNNPRRIIRALSVIQASGKSFSSFRTAKPKTRAFIPIPIFLNMEREKLYTRINGRVDAMIHNGLLEEVKKILPHKKLKALHTVGYTELFNFLEEEHPDLNKAIDLIKRNTRRYAKRQLTWFRNKANWNHFESSDYALLLDFIQQKMS